MKTFKAAALALAGAVTLLPLASTAAETAGFDLCGASSVAAVTAAIEKAGGSVARVIDQTFPDEAIVIARNFPLDLKPRSVSVTLYKGAIVYISIGNAGDLVPAMEAEYGSNFTTSTQDEKVGITTNHHFQDTKDKSRELTISKFEVANNKGTFFSVNYACKDLYKEVEAARVAYLKANPKK
jgi:hypothetical protein